MLLSDYSLIIIGIFIAVLWGLRPVLQKRALNDLSTKTVLLISNLIFTACLLLYSYFHRNEIADDLKNITRGHMKLFVIIAVFCTFLSTILYYNILNENNSSSVVIVTSMSPLFAVIFANIILNEKINPYVYIIAALISFAIAKTI